jgi:hypothetical protein
MRETQALAVRLHQVEPVSPGDGQPDIRTTGKLLLQKPLDLAVDFRVFRRRLAQFQLMGWLTFVVLVVIVVLDVDGISEQPDAGQRGKPLDRGFTFAAVQRHGAHQVAVE